MRPPAQRSATRLLLGGCAAALLAGGCLEPTQVSVEVTTDVPCAELNGVSVTVGAPSAVEAKPPSAVSLACGDDGRVGSIVVVPSDSRDAELSVRIVAGRNLLVEQCEAPTYGPKDAPDVGCIVARRTLRFLPHEPLSLPIVLRAACVGKPCEPTETCVLGTCVDATIDGSRCLSESGCDEDVLTGGGSVGQGGSGGGGAGGAGGGGAGPKRVFVTSVLYPAALGGLSGADAKCQERADAAGLGGNYAAWLSDTNDSPSTRFDRTGPWVLVDGTEVAKDWATLTSGTLAHAIDLTEKGEAPPASAVCTSQHPSAAFSATLADGTLDPNVEGRLCADWTSTSDPAAFLVYGNPMTTTSEWTASGNCNAIGFVCGKTASLYCFQQK